MQLSPEDVERLDKRARQVGAKIGWDLRFHVLGNPRYVALSADSTAVLGPAAVDQLAAHDIELELDALERGDRKIIPDEDGDPRLV